MTDAVAVEVTAYSPRQDPSAFVVSWLPQPSHVPSSSSSELIVMTAVPERRGSDDVVVQSWT